jgi:integrase
LTAVDLDAMYAKWLREGHRQKEGGLSPRTVRYGHTIVRKALADAVKKRILTHNVADAADPPSTGATERISRRKQRTWKASQVRVFLAATTEHRLAAAFRLALSTGMRRGEICGLRWQDIDLDGGWLRVEQSLIAPMYVMEISEPKTEQSRRKISLDSQTVQALRTVRVRQVRERLRFGDGWGADPLAADLVFTDEAGCPVKPALFSLAFKQAVKRAGLPQIRLHDARHTHASLLGAAGVPAKVVQERLGHHSASFTLDVYGHTFPSQDDAAAATWAALVARGTSP